MRKTIRECNILRATDTETGQDRRGRVPLYLLMNRSSLPRSLRRIPPNETQIYKIQTLRTVKCKEERLRMHNWAIVMDLLVQGLYFGDSHLLQK
jgi:hypothetical protein